MAGHVAFDPAPVGHRWNKGVYLSRRGGGDANACWGDVSSRSVPDIDLLIRLHVVKKATDSSRIERTRTEMEEALRAEENVMNGTVAG